MNKRYICWLSSVIIISLGIWGLSERDRAKKLEIKVENNYNRAFHELVNYVDDIDTLLQKSMLVSSPSQMASISSELFRQTSAAKACLGQLPISEIQLENTEKFLSQIGDYTYVLSQNVINNAQITDTDYNNLSSLGDYANTLNEKLLAMQNDVYEGNINFGTIKKESKKYLQTAHAEGVLNNFEGVEKEFQEYPSLIYDGPFSEHMESIKPAMVENAKDIPADKALEIAKEFLGEKGKNLNLKGDSQNNKLPSYSFSSGTDESEIYIAITKQGGFPVYFLENRDVGEEKISVTDAIHAAKRFLKSHGYSSLKESYYDKSNGILTINFAYEQSGIICYSDLIKVRVALDNGDVIGIEMHGYIMNHKYRSFPEIKIPQDEARKKLNSHLSIEKINLALIPKDGQTEKLCYEFTGKHKDHRFIIYLNAETGQEEEILMLIEDENGVLTM